MEELRRERRKEIAVTREFEASRLEEELLAAAYEQAMPPISRLTGSCSKMRAARNVGCDLERRVSRTMVMGGLVG
jgi:hypothetical protein